MDEVFYAAKILTVWFLGMQVIAICVNFGDRKEVRMPWKDLFARTFRHSILMLIAGSVIGGVAYLLLKR